MLTDSGLGMHPGSNGSCMDADATTFKGETIGRWVMGDPLNLDPTKLNTDVAWFGSNFGLEDRYRFGTGSRQANTPRFTYVHTTWDNTTVGNHFDSNRNVWVELQPRRSELKIGVFDKNATVEYDKNWTIVYSPNSIGWAHKITEGGPAPTDGSYDAAVAPPGLPHLGLPRRRHPGQGRPGDHGVVVRELHHHQQHARQPARPHQHVGLERLALRERLEGERRHGRLVPGHLQHEAQLGAVLHAHLPVHGYTYQLKATMRTISWPTNVGGSTGFEIAYQSYNQQQRRLLQVHRLHPRQPPAGPPTRSSSRSRVPAPYLGFNGGPIADGHTVSVGIRDIELSIVAEFVEFDGTNIDVTHTVSMKNMFRTRTSCIARWA